MYTRFISIFIRAVATLIIGAFAMSAYAATDQVGISLTVTADAEPPSTVNGLNATAVSSSQINLTWNAATDNVAVAGYVVYRDFVDIATTTSTSYSNTGLTASTLYAYTITAYDTSFNYATTSATSSATTQAASGGGGSGDVDPPVIINLTPPDDTLGVATTTTISAQFNELVTKQSGNITLYRASDDSVIEAIDVSTAQVTLTGTTATILPSAPLPDGTAVYVQVASGAFRDQAGNPFAGIADSSTWNFTTEDGIPPIISNVIVSTAISTSSITWSTNEPAISSLEWGQTLDYTDGTINEAAYLTSHATLLTGLATSTLYYYQITSTDASANPSVVTGSFTTLNEPDTTPPANVSNLSAIPTQTSANISWSNPADADFAAVRVMRSSVVFPINENDGFLVYDGGSESATDAGLASSTTYYYSVFARDTSSNYSSGAIIATSTLSVGGGGGDGGTGDGGTGDGGSGDGGTGDGSSGDGGSGGEGSGDGGPGDEGPGDGGPGPFDGFPPIGGLSPAIRNLNIGDFQFLQEGEVIQTFVDNGRVVRANATKNLKVLIDYDRVPEVLKTISMTIHSSTDYNESFSVLLRVNPSKGAYESIIAPFGQAGDYPVEISILDHNNHGLKLIKGVIEVHIPIEPEPIEPEPTEVELITTRVTEVIEDVAGPAKDIAPVAGPIGIAVGASQAVVLTANIRSFYDLYLLVLKLFGLVIGLFRRKRNEPWGVVYDSVTKRPLDPAYVIVKKNDNKTSGEAITDLDGRYGFLLNPGEYTIIANKSHYKFPSDKMMGKAKDELFDNLYHGEEFNINREGELVQYNIPLDPIEFDWNEFAKNKDNVFRVFSRKERLRLWVFNTIFYVGLLFSIIATTITPTTLNMIVLGVYAGIIIFQVVWKRTHRVTQIRNEKTGKPIPFAIIKVFLSGIDTVVKKVVADELGRFYMLIPPGKYYLTVEEKQLDGTYKKIHQSDELELKKGVLKDDILVG